MVIVSALGLIAAAVAAWKASQTVELTRQVHAEENLRRAIDAVLSVRYAAEDLARATTNPAKNIMQGQFHAAQQQMERSGVLPYMLLSDNADELQPLIDSLLKADADRHPKETFHNALRAVDLMTAQRPKPMPRWWRTALYNLHWLSKPVGSRHE